MIIDQLLESRTDESYMTNWLLGLDDYYTSSSGENVTQSSAMKLSAWFGSVSILVDDVAKLPRHVFKRSPNGDRQIDYDHPVHRLLSVQPNRRMNPSSFMKLLEYKRVNWGNGYAFVDTDFNGYPSELFPLPPEYTVPYIDDNGYLWYVLNVPGLSMRKLPASEVIHVKGFTTDGITGQSYLGYARDAIGAGLAEQKFEGNLYQKGLKLGGILRTPTKLDPIGKDKVRREFERMTSGLSNMHRVAVLDMGEEFTKIDMPLKDAQFIETKTANIADIARFLKMPLYKLQEGKQAYNSNEQQEGNYLTSTLDPILIQYEEEFHLKLFAQREQKKWYVRFNRNALLRADLAARKDFILGMTQGGVYTLQEGRAFEELNRYEPGSENPAERLLVSRNYVSLENLDKTINGQAPAPATP
jgi:HK97 family phage portal protein